METSNSNWSRRKALCAIVTGSSAGIMWRASWAQTDTKMSRAQAQYQDTPNGIYSCGNCSLFERPKSCKVVEGEVSEDGWCKAFAFVD
jgi:hypothetical protein